MIATKNAYQPDYAIPPGWILEEMLEAREMSHAEFARRCNRSAKLVSDIIAGKAPIEPETALQFEMVLGMDASVWTNVEAEYKLHRAREEEIERLSHLIPWQKKFPISELVKRGALSKPANEIDRVGKLLGFFGVASEDAWNRRFSLGSVAYRHSPTFKSSNEAVATWRRLGEIEAGTQECPEYSEAKFKAALEEIRSLTNETASTFLPGMKHLCNDAGVAFVVIQGLSKTPLSGAAWWLNPRKAIIQQSARYLVNDHFWFTFFHEAAHILLHSKKEVFVDEKDGDGNECEEEANAWAANFLVPKLDWQLFKDREPRSKTEVVGFARQQGIAPGIVVGMLQHECVLPWTHLNALKQRYQWNETNDGD